MSWTTIVGLIAVLGLVIQFLALPRRWVRIVAGFGVALIFASYWIVHPARVPFMLRSYLVLNFLSLLLLAYLAGRRLQERTNPDSKTLRVAPLIAVALLVAANLGRDSFRVWAMEVKMRNVELSEIAPQISERTYPVIGSWASNGRCRYEVKSTDSERIPDFVEIEFQIWGLNPRDGTGWLLMPQPYFDASTNKFLEFEIKGARGGEKIGLSIKDIRGNEVPPDADIGTYCSTRMIESDWQKCRIPLTRFQHVELDGIEAICLYVDRSIYESSKEPQRILLGDLQFR